MAAFGKEAGQRLKDQRKKRGWSRRVAADRLHVTEKTLGTWERAEADPGRRGRWPKIEEVYGVTREQVLGEPEPEQLDRIEAKLDRVLDLLDPPFSGGSKESTVPPLDGGPHSPIDEARDEPPTDEEATG